MARRHLHGDEHENGERWLLTYADMITLLMAFFIMLYSMSQLDIKKFAAMTGSVQAQLGGGGLLKGAQSATPAPEIRSGTPGIAPSFGGKDQAASKPSLREELAPIAHKTGMSLSVQGDEVTVSLPATQLYFAAGSADLTPPAQRALRRLARVLAQRDVQVRVGGHTCDLPVHNDRYRSNWDLSADRARNVAFFLIRLGAVSVRRTSVMGYADTQPLVPNDSEAHRSRNRRVEIVLRPPDAAPASGSPVAPPAAADAATAPPDAGAATAPPRTSIVPPIAAPVQPPPASPVTPVDVRPRLEPAGSP